MASEGRTRRAKYRHRNFYRQPWQWKGLIKKQNFLIDYRPELQLWSSFITLDLKEHFIPRKLQGKELLNFCGHTSHSTDNNMLDLQLATKIYIVLFCLPSHITQALQNFWIKIVIFLRTPHTVVKLSKEELKQVFLLEKPGQKFDPDSIPESRTFLFDFRRSKNNIICWNKRGKHIGTWSQYVYKLWKRIK